MKEKVTSAAAGAVIVVDGIIGRSSGAGSVNTAGEMAEAIDRAVCGGEREATVDIRSTGGDVHEALGMYDILAGSGLRITTRCFGYVASAATIVAQAASPGRRLIAPGALYLIHRAESAAEGNAGDMTAAVELLTKTDAGIAGIYAARSGRSAREFAALMSENGGRGRWLTASETVAAGLADSVIPVRVRGEADPAVWLRRAAGELCTMLGIAPLPLVAAEADSSEWVAVGGADPSAVGAGLSDVAGRSASVCGTCSVGGPNHSVSGGGEDGNRTANRLRDTTAGDVLESMRRLLRRLVRWPARSGVRTENAGPAVVAAPAGNLDAEACGAWNHGAAACGAVEAAADSMTVSPGAGECGGSLRNAVGGAECFRRETGADGGSAAGIDNGSDGERGGARRSVVSVVAPEDTESGDAPVAVPYCTERSGEHVVAPGSSCREAGADGDCGGAADGGSASRPADSSEDASAAGHSVGGSAADESAGGLGVKAVDSHGCGAADGCSAGLSAENGHADGTVPAGCPGAGMPVADSRCATQSSVVARVDGEPGACAGQECRVSDSAAPRWLPVEEMLKRQTAACRTRTVEIEDPSPQGDELLAGNDEAYRLDALGISGR